MGLGTLQLGQRLVWDEAPYKMIRQLDDGAWVLENLASGRFSEHTEPALLDAWNQGALRFAEFPSDKPHDSEVKDLLEAFGDDFRKTYPQSAWEKAKKKLVFVQRLESAPITESVLVPLIKEIWSDSKVWGLLKRPDKLPGWSTVALWLRRYRNSGKDARSLIDRTLDKGNRQPRYCEEVIDIVDDVIETRYLTQERPSEMDVLEDAQGRIERANQSRPKSQAFRIPGITMLKTRIGLIPAFDRYAARYGLIAARLKFRNAGKGAPALKPLARVAMDHCRMNLFVVDEKTGLPLGRPWLTLLLDEYSRYVVGYYLGFEEPSNVSAARAIRQAIRPKTEVVANGKGIVNTWDAWGVIDVLVVDNGFEFHGETVEQGCLQYGIKIQYCPRKKPWYKGKVERFFRSLDQGLTSSIPGKTFENLFKREDYDPAKNAVVTLTTLRSIILKWVVDYYHQKPHRILQMSPSQAWNEGIAHVDQYLPSSSVLLDAAFSKTDTRLLSKDGIENDSLFYQSEDLRRVRERFGNDIEVEIRVMDDDIAWIMVVVPQSKTVLRVNAVDQDYAAGMTRWQHGICKRYKRLKYKRNGLKLTLLAAKEAIREMIAIDTNLIKRSSRAKQKRFMGDEPLDAGNPSPTPAAMAPAVPETEPSPERLAPEKKDPVEPPKPVADKPKVPASVPKYAVVVTTPETRQKECA